MNTERMPRFADFDSRGYRTVDVRTGYRGWVSTYEETVEDAMDVALLDELTPPPGTRCVADTNARFAEGVLRILRGL